MVAALMTTPVLINRLGVESYGIYTLFFVTVSLVSVLDLNLPVGVTKYLAGAFADADALHAREILVAGSALAVPIGLLGAFALFCVAPWVVVWVKVPTELLTVATATIRLSGVGFILVLYSNIFATVPQAAHRYDLVLVGNLGTSLAPVLGATAVVLLQGGLWQAMVATLVLMAFGCVFWLAVAVRLTRWSLSGMAMPSSGSVHSLLRFARGSALGKLSYLVGYVLDRAYVGIALGVGVLPYYTVPTSLANRLLGLASSMTQVFLPAASSMAGEAERERLIRATIRASRLTVAVNALVISVGLSVGDTFLRLWVGEEFALLGWPVLVLTLVTHYLTILTMVPTRASEALGLPHVGGAFSLVQAFGNVVLLFVLTPRFGITGAALAFLIPSLLMVPLFLIYFCRRVLSIPATRLAGALLPSSAVALGAVAAGRIVAQFFGPTLLAVAVVAGTTVAVYVFALLGLRVLPSDDIKMIRSVLGKSRASGE